MIGISQQKLPFGHALAFEPGSLRTTIGPLICTGKLLVGMALAKVPHRQGDTLDPMTLCAGGRSR